MRVKDLPPPRPHKTVTSIDGKVSTIYTRQPLMYCRVCLGEYSASPDAYHAANPELILRCCKMDLMLCDKGIVYSEVIL
jgi:hypothetical protein